MLPGGFLTTTPRMAKLPKVVAAPGLSEAAIIALEIFGGLRGLFEMIRNEFEAAKKGSLVRKQLLDMIVKILTTNALAGGGEDISSMPEEELEEQLQEEVKKHVEATGEDVDTELELDAPPDE